MTRPTKTFVIGYVALVSLIGCSATINKFSVMPRHICAGEAVDVIWSTKGKTSITVNPPNPDLLAGPVKSDGSARFSPQQSTQVILHVTRFLSNPTNGEQDILVTQAKHELLTASLADSETRPGCKAGKVWATVHARRFSPNIKVVSVSLHDGDDHTYYIRHSGISASLQPGVDSNAFVGTSLIGDWKLTAALNKNQNCRDAPNNLVIDVLTQCLTDKAL